jgi:hypothetical protein
MTLQLSEPADLLGMVGQEIGTGGAAQYQSTGVFTKGARSDEYQVHCPDCPV